MKGFLKTYPVASFIVLAFAIAFLAGLPLKIFLLDKVFEGSELGLNYLSKILVVLAPALAAIIVTSADNDNGELKGLLRKLKPDTEHIIWWLAMAFGGILVTMISFVIAGISFNELINLITASNPLLLVMHFIAALVFIGIGEELGWRGFLLPRLLKDRTPATATLIIFVLCSCWYLPTHFGEFAAVVPFTLTCLALSMILTRFWNHVNGNIFVLAVAHAAVSFPQAFFSGRMGEGHEHEVLKAWSAASVVYLFIAAAVYFYDRQWWHQPYKPAPTGIEIAMEDRPGLDHE